MTVCCILNKDIKVVLRYKDLLEFNLYYALAISKFGKPNQEPFSSKGLKRL
jgi:hypothetical protein